MSARRQRFYLRRIARSRSRQFHEPTRQYVGRSSVVSDFLGIGALNRGNLAGILGNIFKQLSIEYSIKMVQIYQKVRIGYILDFVCVVLLVSWGQISLF